MEEYIDIVDETGKELGFSKPKSEVHKKGFYHNTVHIWFYTKQGNILLSQRSTLKTICPLLWDVSVAGHIDAGETIETAAIRETKEEISLDISKNELHKIGVFECFQSYENGIIDNEFHNTFLCELKADLINLTPQPEEVEALKLVSIKEFKKLLSQSETNNHFVASNSTYYETVIQHVKKIIL